MPELAIMLFQSFGYWPVFGVVSIICAIIGYYMAGALGLILGLLLGPIGLLISLLLRRPAAA